MKPHDVDRADEGQSFRTSLLRLFEALSADISRPSGEGDPSSDVWGGNPLAGDPHTS